MSSGGDLGTPATQGGEGQRARARDTTDPRSSTKQPEGGDPPAPLQLRGGEPCELRSVDSGPRPRLLDSKQGHPPVTKAQGGRGVDSLTRDFSPETRNLWSLPCCVPCCCFLVRATLRWSGVAARAGACAVVMDGRGFPWSAIRFVPGRCVPRKWPVLTGG